uniref:Uncharacterized protein n=1 Tax=uncultured marine virus TaxID=186617 RepID=A0A0F7LA72_9VIRU|nr:hypothetical protein [uncultured marine virus]
MPARHSLPADWWSQPRRRCSTDKRAKRDPATSRSPVSAGSCTSPTSEPNRARPRVPTSTSSTAL